MCFISQEFQSLFLFFKQGCTPWSIDQCLTILSVYNTRVAIQTCIEARNFMCPEFPVSGEGPVAKQTVFLHSLALLWFEDEFLVDTTVKGSGSGGVGTVTLETIDGFAQGFLFNRVVGLCEGTEHVCEFHRRQARPTVPATKCFQKSRLAFKFALNILQGVGLRQAAANELKMFLNMRGGPINVRSVL
jgi:hypothetical protein